MLYLANPSNQRVRDAMANGHIGAIMTPKQGNKLPDTAIFCIDNGCGPDKDGNAGGGYIGDEAFLALLRSIGQGDGYDEYDPFTSWCLFAVAPDVLGDAYATLHRAETSKMLGWIRYAGFRAALVGQNGLRLDPARGWGADGPAGEWLPVDWDEFDALFLGGSAECVPCGWVRPVAQARQISRCPHCHRKLTEWKLGAVARELVAEAKRRGKHVHMGRVNSLKRFRYAEKIGCDTADGTFIKAAPDVNLPKVLAWNRAVRDTAQTAMFDMVGAA
jgi:hypothetical protein